MHRCAKCGGEFGEYATPGQCPLCGGWEVIGCRECGYRGAASFYLESSSKCPRCGAEAELPGNPTQTRLVLAGLVAVGLMVVTALVLMVTGLAGAGR